MYGIPKCSERFNVYRRFNVGVVGIEVARAKPSITGVTRLVGSPSMGNVFYMPGCSGPSKVACSSRAIHTLTTLGPSTPSFHMV